MATIFARKCKKKGKTYTVRIRRKGVPDLTKTFRKKTQADAWARKQEHLIDNGKAPTVESTKRTFNDLKIAFIQEHLDESDPEDRRRANYLAVWCEHIGDKKLCDIKPSTICSARRKIQHAKHNRGEKRSNATVNRYKATLSKAFRYAVEELSWLDENPAKQVTNLPESPPPIRFLDKKTELPKLMEACAKSENQRLLPLFMLAICLGLRAFALLWLHRDEVNLERMTIRIPVKRSKNERAFTLGISDVLYPYVKFLMDNCHPESGLLFPDPKNPFKRMCYRIDWASALTLAGIINYRFHDNRHTCGSYLAMAGHTLTEIAELLNHKTLEMAKRYSHLADEYREKLSGRMNKEFIAEAADSFGRLSGITHPDVSIEIDVADSTNINNKPHLLRVK